MATAANGLKIRFGLRSEPTDAQIRQWAQAVKLLVSRGSSREQAGTEAAKQVFPDFRTVIYASEADTIEALLRLAENK